MKDLNSNLEIPIGLKHYLYTMKRYLGLLFFIWLKRLSIFKELNSWLLIPKLNLTFESFSASTFITPYLHQVSAMMQKMHLFSALWNKFALCLVRFNIINKKIMPELYLPNLLFWTNFWATSAPKHQNSTIFNTQLALFKSSL